MVGAGMFMLTVGLVGWYLARKGQLESNRLVLNAVFWTMPASYLANATGWFVTEAGRQPWLVVGLQTTAKGVSPNVSAAEIWISMIGFTVVYAVLAVCAVFIAKKYIVQGPDHKAIADTPVTKGATLWN